MTKSTRPFPAQKAIVAIIGNDTGCLTGIATRNKFYRVERIDYDGRLVLSEMPMVEEIEAPGA